MARKLFGVGETTHGGGANIKTILLGVISIVVGLIMLGIAMDQVDSLIGTGSTVNWTNYPGGEAILGLFPLLMMITLVLFGGILIWLGYKGVPMEVKDTIMGTIVVVIAVILLPIVIDQADTLLARADIDNYSGLSSFLGLVPLLYVVGISFVTGLLGFRAVKGKL